MKTALVQPGNVHTVPVQILEAAAIAQSRIPQISRTEPSLIYFTSGHESTPLEVQIAILPRRIQKSNNYLYKVFCRVALSHDTFDVAQLHRDIQRWYDTFGAGWWTIDSTCCTICQRPSGASREQTKASNAKWLEETALGWLKETAVNWLEVAKDSKVGSKQRDQFPRKADDDSEHGGYPQVNFAAVFQTANDIITAIRQGQDQLVDRKTTNQADCQAEISAILRRDISECLRIPGDDIIAAISNMLSKARKDSKSTPNMVSWLYWYLQGSLDKVDILTREKRKESSKGVSVGVINTIFSRLLFSDGLPATSVLASLGDLDHLLHWTKNVGKPNRAFLSKLVACGLHGNLVRPPAWYRMPNGPGWVNLVRKARPSKGNEASFESTCSDLDLPHLSALGLEISRQDMDNMELDILDVLSVKLDESWTSFEEQMKPELTLLRQLHALLIPSDEQQESSDLNAIRQRLESGDLLFHEADQPGTMRMLASLVALTKLLKEEGHIGLHQKLKSDEAGDLLGKLVEVRQLFWLLDMRTWLEMDEWSEGDQDKIAKQIWSDEGLLLLGSRRYREFRKLTKDVISHKLRTDPDLARELLLEDTMYHSFLCMAGHSLLEPEFLRCATTWKSKSAPQSRKRLLASEASRPDSGFTAINTYQIARHQKRTKLSASLYAVAQTLDEEETTASATVDSPLNSSATGADRFVSESDHALVAIEVVGQEQCIPIADSPADASMTGAPPQHWGTVNPDDINLAQIRGLSGTAWEPWDKNQNIFPSLHLDDPYWGGDASPGGRQEEAQIDWQSTNSRVYGDPSDEDMELELPGL